MPSDTAFDRFNRWLTGSITLKLVVVAVLALLLLIPAAMIESLIRERSGTQQAAISEISASWSGPQVVTGPVLVVPYTRVLRSSDGTAVETTDYAFFLPEALSVEGQLAPETRYRGIYEAVVYQATARIEGTFARPDFGDWSIAPGQIRWSEAALVIGLSDLRGINERLAVDWSGTTVPFDPGVGPSEVVPSGALARIPLAADATAPLAFAINLDLNGSVAFQVTPVGRTTEVALTSPWPHPSFVGAFLPDARTVADDGFTAQWRVLHLNRNLPQRWRSTSPIRLAGYPQRPDLETARLQQGGAEPVPTALGVRLLVPVDHYRKATRAAKYALLVIALTFLTFFFSETRERVRVHPFQYVLVGLALCLFYALLVALSEHLRFNVAYLLAGGATISLVALYSRAVFRSTRLSLVMGGLLVVLYGFVFVLLQLQDYALLIGALGLFVALALTMYLSRRIDWYGVGQPVEVAG